MPGTTISSAAVNSDFSDIATALTDSLAADGQTSMTGGIKALAGSASTPGYAFVGALQSGWFSAGGGNVGATVNGTEVAVLTSSGWTNAGGIPNTIPIGMMMDFAGSWASPPTGWYACYGQAVSRTTYAALFAVVGTVYGSGDGVTTFNLPDTRGIVLAGQDNMGNTPANRISTAGSGLNGQQPGSIGGSQNETFTLTQANLPSLTLSTNISSGQGAHSHGPGSGNAFQTDASTTNVTGGSGGQTLFTSTVATTANAILPSMSGTTNTGGSSTSITVTTLQPTLIVAKMIFAGA